MSNSNGPLGVHENQAVIQARIEGLYEQQIPVVNRLHLLGVPDVLISSAMCAEPTSLAYELAEESIVMYIRGSCRINEKEALLLLNGK